METPFTTSIAAPETTTFTHADGISVVTAADAENVFLPPKKFPVFCGDCWVPIRDLAALKKHRAAKRHYCREYPTSYQKQAFVKKDFRKSWRKERTRFNPRIPTTSPNSAAPSSSHVTAAPFTFQVDAAPLTFAGAAPALTTNHVFAASPTTPSAPSRPKSARRAVIAPKPSSTLAPQSFRLAVASTSSPPAAECVFNLHDLFNPPDAQAEQLERSSVAAGNHDAAANSFTFATATPQNASLSTSNPANGGIVPALVQQPSGGAEEEGTMDATPSAPPFDPFQAARGNLGGYFTYSRQNSFVVKPPMSEIPGIVPLPAIPPGNEARSSSSLGPPRMHPSLPRTSTTLLEVEDTLVKMEGTNGDSSFSNTNHAHIDHADARAFVNQLRAFREEGFLTDIFLIVEEKRVNAHKLVLSAQSAFFRDLIGKCVSTPSYGLRLDFGFSHDAFLIALDFMYGVLPKDKIHTLNAAEVKAVALKLELDGLRQYSEEVLEGGGEMTVTASAVPTELTSANTTTLGPLAASETTTISDKTVPDLAPIFEDESSLPELSSICAEFTATALDSGDPLETLDAMEEETENASRSLRGKPDPPLSSVDGSRNNNNNNLDDQSPIAPYRKGQLRRDSQSSLTMTPNHHQDSDGMANPFRADLLPSAGLNGIDDNNPFDDLFNFGDGNTNSSVFGSPIFSGGNINNNNETALDPLGAQQKIVFSPPPVVHAPKLAPLPPVVCKEPPPNLMSSPLKRPVPGKMAMAYPPPPLPTPQPPTSTKEFSAMLSTQYSTKDGNSAVRTCMNCIICGDMIEGQTKIEQWIKLCQHLAEKHKKVIDREILTKQFGIRDSAISSTVLEGERGASACSSSPGFSGKPSSLNSVKLGLSRQSSSETATEPSTLASSSATAATAGAQAAGKDKRGDAKARLNRFLCQKRLLNAELMIHVKKVPSTLEGKDDRYSCLRCAKEFDSLTPMQRHLVVNHGVPLPGLQILMCSHCGNKDVDREENMSESGPSKSCNVCKHRMSRHLD